MGTQHFVYALADSGVARVLIHAPGVGLVREYRSPAAESLLGGIPPDVGTRPTCFVVVGAGMVSGQHPLSVQLVQAGRVRQAPGGATIAAAAGSTGRAAHALNPSRAASTGSRPVAEAASSAVRVSPDSGPAIRRSADRGVAACRWATSQVERARRTERVRPLIPTWRHNMYTAVRCVARTKRPVAY